ncbi:hypothetical protein FY034_07420 [Trichlorobacter lovleyi]|uniref:hypothetical protein n=1 Tax=Trichlorobacter lovleyi TaxID=313985 RepID=UPI0022409FBD|nr:hypothetical protein [Trichlorobacter lovleyi]QOX78766.1 hypothetical protein FY034_07420 [Trichlorobacter lovleyi]
MRYLIALSTLLLLINTAIADVYSWEDKDGMHFVDDPGKVPVKYQNKMRSDGSSPRTNIHPRVIDGKLDVLDLQQQFRYNYNNDVINVCDKTTNSMNKQVDDAFLSKDHDAILKTKISAKKSDCEYKIKKANMDYYRGIIRIHMRNLSVSEHRYALDWSL